MLPFSDDESNPALDRVSHALRADGVKCPEQNPLRSGVHTRGYLPHVKREGATYFVTFRLADALPRAVMLRFERERAERLRLLHEAERQGWTTTDSVEEINRDFHRQAERFLDQGHGACHLRRPEIAELMANTLLHFEGERHLLSEWVVMPNHVHAVLWPMPNCLLTDILKSWKQFVSRRAKRIVGIGEEAFWQRESFDHWIRDETEKARICRYIRNNPTTARLCAKPEDWRWSSAYPGWGRSGEGP
jgi:REP element-mobilizing transposase RayT